MSTTALWWGAFAGLLLIYLTTAHWYGYLSVDTQAADWGGWQIAHAGSNDLTGLAGLPDNPFFVHVSQRLVAARTAGVVVAGVPLQVLLSPLHLRPDTPGVLTACLLTAAAMANMTVLLRGLMRSTARALGCVSALALGTAVWTVAGSELWTHSPDLFWLSCLLLAASRERLWLAAATCPPLLWTRLHLALPVVAVAFSWAVARKTVRPLVALGISSVLGLGLLVAWNDWMFGQPSLGGAYESHFSQLGGTTPNAASEWFTNLIGASISPSRGILIYSPIVVIGAASLIRGWRSAPAWARGGAVGGLAYQAVQLRLNTFTGGSAFFGNRLVLEMLLLCTPVAAVGYARWREENPRIVPFARALTAVSVAIHATGAMLGGSGPVLEDLTDPWHTWLLGDAVRALGTTGATLAITATLLVTAVVFRPRWRTTAGL